LTNAGLTSATVTISESGAPVPQGTVVTLIYENGNGVPINPPNGGPDPTATVGPGGTVVINPPNYAQALGNKVQIQDPNNLNLGQPDESKPLNWNQSSWIWGGGLFFKIDPLGQPGITSPQSWFIQDQSISLTGVSSAGLPAGGTVTSSNFDLSYTSLGGSSYEAVITGNNSFIQLSDQTIIPLGNGLDFGSLQYNAGSTTDGTFDFSAIGLAGSFSWDSSSNYTGGLVTSVTDWSGYGLSVSSVPEPSSLLLLGVAVVMFSGARWLLARA